MKNRRVNILSGGGGSRSTGKSRALDTNVILNSERSERDSGSVQRYELVSNVGQTLNQVQGDKNMQCVGKCLPSLRADGSRRGNPVEDATSLTGSPRASALAMTPTESVLCLVNRLSVKKCAFTMAEILLSLTIIGVVAAITLPSLTGNINERTWNTQRKALYARFSQAIALMPALNGYGTLRETTDSAGSTSIEDTAAETFVTNGLAKVLKINNICDSDHLEDCGITTSLTNAVGSKISTPAKVSDLFTLNTSVGFVDDAGNNVSYSHLDTKAAAFETANGESILAFYNPTCSGFEVAAGGSIWVPDKVCANFIYDLNGNKGPNTFGKDIGLITAFYPTDSVVAAPVPYLRTADLNVAWHVAASSCKNLDSEYRTPNLEEMMALMYNHDVANVESNKYWTSKRDGNTAWVVSLTNRVFRSNVGTTSDNQPMAVRCVKR